MGRYEKDWARRQRQMLLNHLGNKCAKCKTLGTKKNPLTFDCIIPKGDAHHKYDTSHRMSFYRQQWFQDNLQILCKRCNDEKGRNEDKNFPF